MKARVLMTILLAVAAARGEEQRSAANGLQDALSSAIAAVGNEGWVGYTVPAPDNKSEQILFRVKERKLHEIRLPSNNEWQGLELRPQITLTNVNPADSVHVLSGYLNDPEKRLQHGALGAIAAHADPAADAVLETMLDKSKPEEMRKQAVFWLGAKRGARGVERIRRLLREETSDKVREHASFALSISHDPAALPLMIEMIRTDQSAKVRKQAMFWLAHSKDPRAIEYINKLF